MKLIHMFLIISLMLPTLATANNQQNGNRKAMALGFATLATVCYTLAANTGIKLLLRPKIDIAIGLNKPFGNLVTEITTGTIFVGCGILSTIAAVKLYKKAKAEEQR